VDDQILKGRQVDQPPGMLTTPGEPRFLQPGERVMHGTLADLELTGNLVVPRMRPLYQVKTEDNVNRSKRHTHLLFFVRKQRTVL
jgi:hypothetical protein